MLDNKHIYNHNMFMKLFVKNRLNEYINQIPKFKNYIKNRKTRCIAAAFDITRTSLENYKNNHSQPSYQKMLKICSVLSKELNKKIRVEDVFYMENSSNTENFLP